MEEKLSAGPRLKIERAKKHINDLHALLQTFSQSNFCKLWTEINPDTGKNAVKFAITKALPDDLALILGDAVHNLRSALDFAISDILLPIIGARSKKAKFPVYDTRNNLVGSVGGGHIKQAPKKIIDLIVDVIKPYPGGNDPLCALHDLDILDKHMLLLPVIQVAVIKGVDMVDDQGNIFVNGTIGVNDGQVAMPFAEVAGNLKITGYGQVAFTVLFNKGLPTEGQPVVPTLTQFTELVSGIIEAFDAALKS
jgi:hypothetical protein